MKNISIFKGSLAILCIMSIVFMPLANRQSAWMMLVILISTILLLSTTNNKIIYSVKNSISCKVSFIWIILYTIYFIISVLTKGTEGIRIYYFSSIIWLILGIIIYTISKTDDEEKGLAIMIKYSTILLVLLFIRFMYLFVSQTGGSSEELKNTIPYYLMYLSIPVLLKNSRVGKYILIFLIAFFILLSTKRGPLLLMILSGGMTYLLTNNRSLIFKIISISSIAILISVVGFIIFPDLIDKFIGRFDVSDLNSDQGLDDLTSTRSIIWAILVDYWISSDISHQICGFGLNAVPEYLEMLTFHNLKIFAHSDWVDTMFNLGGIGLFTFLLFHIALIKEIRKALKYKNKYAHSMLYGYLMFCFSNFFTGSLVSFTTIWFSLFFFYFAAKTKKDVFHNNPTI